MKNLLVATTTAFAIIGTSLTSANAAAEISAWGTPTQVIVRVDEVKVFFDVSTIPNPANCNSNDSVAIVLPTSPAENNYYETMVASALSALAGNLDVKFNIVDHTCSATNRPVVNQVRLKNAS